MFRQVIIALNCLALGTSLWAQGTENLLTTVGTTVKDGSKSYAYLLWQPGDVAATLGKRFAIYSKPGAIGTSGAFTRLGIQTLQTSPTTMRALLELGSKVDVAGEHAASRIDGIYREITLRAGEAPAAPAEPNLDAAGKLAFLIQGAVADPQLLSRLFFLGRAHPGVMMCLGHAFAIAVPSTGMMTYEVREVDSAGTDVQVMGRVALDPSAPLVLDAPAAPVQVPHEVKAGSQYPINPKDDLNARFRWGVGPALKDKMAYSFGFDLFRVKQAVAVSLGWHAAPPAPAVMLSAVESMADTNPNPDFSRVNSLPLLVEDLLSPATAADLSDKSRFDVADDGIWHSGVDGKALRRPYADGEAFYYFVAARGITGLPGNLSAGTLVQLCDRQPPHPPSIASVLGTFTPPTNPADWASQGGAEFLRVKFRQVVGSQREEASGYYIYRWSTSQEYLNSPGNPVINRIGYVAHLSGTAFRNFDDRGAGAPTLASHHDRSVWYTVRAVGRSACAGEVLSGHSAPMGGVLRDFKAPDRPGGSFLVCRARPWVEFVGRYESKPRDGSVPADFRGLTVEVERKGPLIVASRIEVFLPTKNSGEVPLYTKLHYFQRGNFVRANLPFIDSLSRSERITIRVTSLSSTGLMSAPAQTTAPTQEVPSSYARYQFKTDVTRDCVPIETVTDNPPIHETRGPLGEVIPITGSILIPLGQGAREWRVYRRIGADGELSLIAKQEGSLPATSTWTDDAPPNANGAEICYYAQVLDQNGNPSPLSLLGCVTAINPDLATPMLSPAKILAEAAGVARVKLEWFCDPVGVERFEILVAQKGGGMPSVGGLSDALADSPLSGVSADFPDLAFYPFQSPRVTQTFGPGPDFGLTVEIPADKVLYFAVRACGPGTYPRASGPASNVVSARWETPVSGPQPIIPWPTRDLPTTFETRRAIEAYGPGEGPFWSMVAPPALLSATPTVILVGLVHAGFEANNTGRTVVVSGTTPPESWLFKMRDGDADGSTLQPLMPFMIYRYQVPSAAFPQARANLVQCTPLLDRMSWKESYDEKNGNRYTIVDPFFTFQRFAEFFPVPISGAWDDKHLPTLGQPASAPDTTTYLKDATGMIMVKDPLPVITGGRYRHLIVTFTADGEIRRVIPLEPVQH